MSPLSLIFILSAAVIVSLIVLADLMAIPTELHEAASIDGATPAQAYLYHLAEYDASLYDDAHRSQLAIPPVSTATEAFFGTASMGQSLEGGAGGDGSGWR